MKKLSAAQPDESHSPAFRVRLPGFLLDEEVGLGDLIKKSTYFMGLKPCSGCERRAATLNRWMTFSGPHRKQ
jgi:hypothetical protein